jgi:hypothetical protein
MPNRLRHLCRRCFDVRSSAIITNRLTIRGGGAYYSFTRLTHEYGLGSDIELQPVPTNDFVAPPIAEYDFLTGFAGADYGFIVTLGNVPLEKVTLLCERRSTEAL